MTPAAAITLRALFQALSASRHADVRPLAQLVNAALVADSLEPESPPPAKGPAPSTLRVQAFRERERQKRGETRFETPFQEEGVGGGVSSDLADIERDSTPKGGGSGGGETRFETPHETRRSVRNATDDGAFGSSIGAWCEGLASVTGVPFSAPTHGLQRALVQCFVDQQRAGSPHWQGDIVEAARAAAAAYAEAHRGRTLSPHGYMAWEGSDRPERESVTLAKAGEVDMSKCKSCQAPIRWVITAAGKRMPLDEAPSPKGNMFVYRVTGEHDPRAISVADEGHVARQFREQERERFMPHHATCPKAAQHRKAASQ